MKKLFIFSILFFLCIDLSANIEKNPSVEILNEEYRTLVKIDPLRCDSKYISFSIPKSAGELQNPSYHIVKKENEGDRFRYFIDTANIGNDPLIFVFRNYNTKFDNWTVVDALGRRIDQSRNYPSRRENKRVGIFYFIWQGAHGYDKHGQGQRKDEGVIQPSEADSVSPYDISEILRNNPENPSYGPVHAFHHWGEPYLGYYVANDVWVIRKHAQMISDAGIDAIMVDVTNAAIYAPQVNLICETYLKMRNEGNRTPQIAFVVNSRPKETMTRIYREFYKNPKYEELWFYWKGKPLVLCPPEGISDEYSSFFTFRHCWFASSNKWFANGRDKWTWADFYPQQPGWHESQEKPEEVSICPATHPTSNIGRSHYNNKQPSEIHPEKGLYFSQQIDRALEIDPEFVFITGWNEWVAMRFTDGRARMMLGKKIEKGDSYFVDQYNEEFSRDIEPVKGKIGDNYYYQMVDFVRRYKGVDNIDYDNKFHKIKIDGSFSDWSDVNMVFKDDQGDNLHRNHHGWGRFKSYVDNTGRNDIIETKVTSDKKNIYFYVRTLQPIQFFKNCCLNLFLKIINKNDLVTNNFDYIIGSSGWQGKTVSIYSCMNDENQLSIGKGLDFRIHSNELEVSIPKHVLRISSDECYIIDFKWIDNPNFNGDIMKCMSEGDTAPNSRFCYRYQFKN